MTVLQRRVALMRHYGLLLAFADLWEKASPYAGANTGARRSARAGAYGETRAEARDELRARLVAEQEARVAADLERLKGGPCG